MTATGTRAAGLGRRLGAMLYDSLLVVALWMATLFPLVALTNGAVTGPTLQSLLFLELYAFFSYFWVARGQTAGMLAWRLHIVSNRGGSVTLRQALLRFIGALLSFITLGLGHLWLLLDSRRRSWPDLLSGTQLVYQPKTVPGAAPSGDAT